MDYFDNISYMVSHVFLMLFFYLFLVHRYSKAKTARICFFSFVLLCLLDCLKLNIFPESDLCYAIVTILQILNVQSTGILISDQRNGKVLFMCLSASNYVIAGSIAATIFRIYTGRMIPAIVGSIVIHAGILLVLCAKIKELWLEHYKREYVKSWWELCLIPVFFYCGFSFLAFFPFTLYDNPENIPGVLIFIITMFVSYVVVLRYMESELKKADIYWKNVMFESYIKGLENQYDLVERSEQNLRILRHDMRHYSRLIDTLLDQREYDEIRKIAAHINEVVNENKVTKYCGHLLVNAILSQMMEKAAVLGIKVCLDAAVSKTIPVSDYEFALVLANLFENAIICVKDLKKEKRYINAQIHCSEEHLLIRMENPYEQEMVMDPATGLPKSAKGGGHGLGMQSVSTFSEKIGGNIGCSCQDFIFQIVMFAKF